MDAPFKGKPLIELSIPGIDNPFASGSFEVSSADSFGRGSGVHLIGCMKVIYLKDLRIRVLFKKKDALLA